MGRPPAAGSGEDTALRALEGTLAGGCHVQVANHAPVAAHGLVVGHGLARAHVLVLNCVRVLDHVLAVVGE